MDRSADRLAKNSPLYRIFSMCGLLTLGVGCTIAPINCAPDTDDDGSSAADAGAVADAGVAVDAGDTIEDAGVQDDAGSGTLDGGDTSSDGGVVSDDGGSETDAGTVACTDTDSALGTLVLADGYVLTDSASIPDDAIAVAPYTGTDAATHLAILRSTDLSVRDLGVWPALGEDTTLFNLVPDDADVESPYASGYLVGDGSLLAAGYTAYDADTSSFPGKLALWNGTEVTYLQADGNYSAAIYNDILLVNGLGAGDVGDAAAVYGAGLINDAWVGRELATFPAAWGAYSGYNAVTSDGVALLGGYFTYDDVMSNHLIGLPASELSAAWENETPVSLEGKPVIASGDMLSVASMDAKLAILRGSYGEVADGVFVLELQTENDTVSALGDEAAVLTSTDECTPIHFVSTFESDIMVAVGNTGAMKVLRISQAE